MPKFIGTAPTGNRYEVDAPENGTQAQADEFVARNYKKLTNPLIADAKHESGKTYRFPSDSAAIEFISRSRAVTNPDVVAEAYGGKPYQRKELAQMSPDERVTQIPSPSPEQSALTANNPTRPEPRSTRLQIGDVVGPTVEALGGIGGAALGGLAGVPTGPLAPAGAIAGAGLGYAAARQLLGATGLAENKTGPVENTLIGMTGQAGGQVIVNALAKGVQAAKPLLKGVTGMFGGGDEIAKEKAQVLLKDALARDQVSADTIRAVMQQSPDMPAGQALARAGVASPTTQALLDNYMSKYAQGFKSNALAANKDKNEQVLGFLMGGLNQTAATQSRQAAVKNLNEVTEPVRIEALGKANIYNEMGTEGQAATARANAAQGAADVRRIGAASARAGQIGTAADSAVTAPGVADRYFKLQDLGDAATGKAAKYSLDQGEVARDFERATKTLQASGLAPLKTDSIIEGIRGVMADPAKAGNAELGPVMTKVSDLIRQWTNANGVIDAVALDSIRKNAVSSIVADLKLDPKVASQVTARSLKSIQPLIEDAMELAGGAGYKAYLRDYATRRSIIESRPELAAQAKKLFDEDPQKFINLIKGNNPDAVEAVFGPGNFDIVKQMGTLAMRAMQDVADRAGAQLSQDAQIAAGQSAMRQVLIENKLNLQVPNLMDAKVAIYNRMIRGLTGNVDAKTARILTEGAKSGQKLEQILAQLPDSKIDRVIELLKGKMVEQGLAAGIRDYQE